MWEYILSQQAHKVLLNRSKHGLYVYRTLRSVLGRHKAKVMRQRPFAFPALVTPSMDSLGGIDTGLGLLRSGFHPLVMTFVKTLYQPMQQTLRTNCEWDMVIRTSVSHVFRTFKYRSLTERFKAPDLSKRTTPVPPLCMSVYVPNVLVAMDRDRRFQAHELCYMDFCLVEDMVQNPDERASDEAAHSTDQRCATDGREEASEDEPDDDSEDDSEHEPEDEPDDDSEHNWSEQTSVSGPDGQGQEAEQKDADEGRDYDEREDTDRESVGEQEQRLAEACYKRVLMGKYCAVLDTAIAQRAKVETEGFLDSVVLTCVPCHQPWQERVLIDVLKELYESYLFHFRCMAIVCPNPQVYTAVSGWLGGVTKD